MAANDRNDTAGTVYGMPDGVINLLLEELLDAGEPVPRSWLRAAVRRAVTRGDVRAACAVLDAASDLPGDVVDLLATFDHPAVRARLLAHPSLPARRRRDLLAGEERDDVLVAAVAAAGAAELDLIARRFRAAPTVPLAVALARRLLTRPPRRKNPDTYRELLLDCLRETSTQRRGVGVPLVASHVARLAARGPFDAAHALEIASAFAAPSPFMQLLEEPSLDLAFRLDVLERLAALPADGSVTSFAPIRWQHAAELFVRHHELDARTAARVKKLCTAALPRNARGAREALERFLDAAVGASWAQRQILALRFGESPQLAAELLARDDLPAELFAACLAAADPQTATIPWDRLPSDAALALLASAPDVLPPDGAFARFGGDPAQVLAVVRAMLDAGATVDDEGLLAWAAHTDRAAELPLPFLSALLAERTPSPLHAAFAATLDGLGDVTYDVFVTLAEDWEGTLGELLTAAGNLSR